METIQEEILFLDGNVTNIFNIEHCERLPIGITFYLPVLLAAILPVINNRRRCFRIPVGIAMNPGIVQNVKWFSQFFNV